MTGRGENAMEMESVAIASLSNSFRQVPLSAVPAIVDCILASTGLSPSTLFSSLFESFRILAKDSIKDLKLYPHEGNYIMGVVGALCHLLKNLGTNSEGIQLFIWQCFMPLMEVVYELNREMLNKIVESFFDVVATTNSWSVLEATMVPYFLRSVGLSIGMHQNEETDVFEWSQYSVFQGLNDLKTDDLDKELRLSPSASFPLPISLHILAQILDFSLQSFQIALASGSCLSYCSCTEELYAKLLWDLCSMSQRLLLESMEPRSCAIGILLPVIFEAFARCCSFQISVHGTPFVLSRNLFFRKIWNCCRTLFCLGSLERRDAYSTLSLYLSFFSCTDGCKIAEGSGEAEGFDIRVEREFWDEIKEGLVAQECLVRKQSLHILKATLCAGGEWQFNSGASEKNQEKHLISRGMTKREKWAEKEAKSLGVTKYSSSIVPPSNCKQHWEAFILLYEMLEEYGTHLVEAAWNHQVALLLQFCVSHENSASCPSGVGQDQIEASSEIFCWLTILWQLGFRHDNPQVRCLIMQSFLGIEWSKHSDALKSVPESFVLGPFIEGLNDPVHHRDFGLKGVYSSRTIEDAVRFLNCYTSHKNVRKGIGFLYSLATVAKYQSFGRAGLMGLAECIASAAHGLGKKYSCKAEWILNASSDEVLLESSQESCPQKDKTELLHALRFVIESSKQHFNANYRVRVCDKVLEAACLVVTTFDVPIEILLHFISTLPREFTDYGGSLRVRVQEWLLGCDKLHSKDNYSIAKTQLLKSLRNFAERFVSSQCSVDASVTFDDEELDAWESEAKRWARVLFLVIKGQHELAPILKFIQNNGVNIGKPNGCLEQLPVKFLVLTMSLVAEVQVLQERVVDSSGTRSRSETTLLETDRITIAEASIINEKFSKLLLFILDGIVSFANISCSIFWSGIIEETALPSSVRGKLGGPSQRRLSSSMATAVLQVVISMRAVASISLWCAQFKADDQLDSVWRFLWKFFWKTISTPTSDSETGAEICLAAYEALAPVLRALILVSSPLAFNLIEENAQLLPQAVESKHLLDLLVVSFLQNINNLLSVGMLARTRRAVLLNWKWLCLESLLSIPLHSEDTESYFSDTTIRYIFCDLVESIENAGEGYILPILRSTRLTLGLFASGNSGSHVSTRTSVDAEMMWRLVRSSWILHVSSNKRRVPSIAALLSSILHTSVFIDEGMHLTNNTPGPLKWFIGNLLEEGTKSPRTIRLAALHLTGLWLSYPRTLKYYIKDLKLLTLYGSVAFDEDFEAELAENRDAKTEVALLAKGPDPELTQAFINTELYARVSVAALFCKLADLADTVGSANKKEDCDAALESGKLFLLELLDSVVNDKDLAKELYKKYSGIHRRKIRVWQMICILSRFVTSDIVGQVTENLHVALYRNNLPAVRQYLETFAINIYLKFPSLVAEQLVPLLRDYDMRPQALSSYVFIATNIICHASKDFQTSHLNELLPPVIPLLTSHHHSLRGFTQLLVYQVFCKYFPPLDDGTSVNIPLEKRCFEDLKLYLAKNPDCRRLRASMEGYLDAYDPIVSSTPAGIFVNRVEELEFECVPTSLMEEVLNFLNDAREDLRCSMAKDIVTIKNDSLKISENPNSQRSPSNVDLLVETSMDFQKKITLSTHEKENSDLIYLSGNNDTYTRLLEMEKEDELLDQSFRCRSLTMETLRSSRQQFILVASLLDRIPNLAGLTRTCEVFKASGLAIADASILRDKQFQLISVTAEKWVPIIEVPVNSVKQFLEKKKREGFSILGLEQTANSVPLDQYVFTKKTVLVLGREKQGIPVDIIHILDACVEIPQLGVVRSLNVHVSGAIALWEYTRQQRSQ